jgi:hypothetical protein
MKTDLTIGQLLRWRLAQAEATAPPALRAARLLEQAQPWWETWPTKFATLVAQLNATESAYGHAMTNSAGERAGHPVPVVISLSQGDHPASARVLFVSVRDGRLRLRFELSAGVAIDGAAYDATFLGIGRATPLLDAPALRSVGNEYRIDAELPAELQTVWADLKVTDQMPFRLILRATHGEPEAVLT